MNKKQLASSGIATIRHNPRRTALAVAILLALAAGGVILWHVLKPKPVPAKAVVIEKGGAYIFVMRPDSVVEKRFVETGPEVGGNNIIIERGIARGEHIVTEGYHKLRHGMKVAPTEETSALTDSIR